jgi:hypothetical protein
MRASQVFRYRTAQDGVTVEMVIWALPRPSAERPHGLKYRLYCGRGNRCFVRYDNETGKGDHRHYGDREESYRFESLEKLLEDFREDCTRLAGWRWR